MLPLVKVSLPSPSTLIPALESVIYSGIIGEGEHVYKFEELFSQKFHLENGLAMSSGTAALHSALILSGVTNGDEVITTSMTAEPTNTTIIQSGGIPIFADVDVKNGNVLHTSIEDKITTKTKAIVVVHYAGYPVDIQKIKSIAEKHNLYLIEDCAHALGAMFAGEYVGTFGDFSIFSFQAIKHLTTIDGGFLAIKDKTKIRLAKKIRWFGLEKGIDRTLIDITNLGYKYNMNNVTAEIGISQLATIDERIDRHKNNGKYYDEKFISIPGLKGAEILPTSEPSYWLYTLLSDEPSNVIECLKKIDVMASKLHRPNHLHTIFGGGAQKLPFLDEFYSKMVHIPCGWWVSDEEREKIINCLSRG